jgi:hypothetical protein
LAKEGIKLADEGNCAEAIERLGRAEQLFSAPTSLARLGECQVAVGRLVVGTENLQRVVRTELASTAPPAFKVARERARKVLEEALPRIARLTIKVTPSPATISVTLDGEKVSSASLGTERAVDPGAHSLAASADGFEPATAKVSLGEGQKGAVTLELKPSAPSTAAAPATPSASAAAAPSNPPGEPGPRPPQHRSNVVPYALVGVGVVAVGVGAAFGIIANGKKNDLACPNKVCPSSESSHLDSAKTAATVSTIAVAAGSAAGLVGAILLLTSGRGSDEASTPRPVVVAGPHGGAVGLRGAF